MTDSSSETASTLRSTTGAGSATTDDETAVTPAQPVHPYVHVVVVAVIGAVAVLAWLVVFETLNKLIWENAFVVANPWMFPVICLPFSLLVVTPARTRTCAPAQYVSTSPNRVRSSALRTASVYGMRSILNTSRAD